MPMEPPPSRYRVVERGGRLEVIDSAVGGAPLTARELLPAADGTPSPMPVEDEAPTAQPTVAAMARDVVDRPSFTTARWYDAKAPRTLRLKPEAGNQAGCALLIAAAVAFAGIVLALSGDVVGWVLLFVVFVAARQAKPIVTVWLDRQAIS